MTQERQPKYLQRRFVSDLPPAKGSILVFDGTSLKWVRVVVGSNDQVLTTDSAQAVGVKWATGHAAVTLGADADTLLGLSGQALSLDTQTANLIFAGPSSGGAADPTFRALVLADLPAGVAMLLKVKEADETVNNSNVLQDDNELLFAVAADEVWQFEGVLILVTTAVADFQLTFTGPAGAVGSFATIYGALGAAQSMGSAGLAAAVSLTATVAGKMVRFWGGIHNGANAGNLTLQWAQDTAEVSDTQVLAGSYIKYQLET